MNRTGTLLLCCSLELAVVTSVSIANLFDGALYALFYNLVYGLVVSTAIPLLILRKDGRPLEEAGARKLGRRQWVVLVAFVAASVGGQLVAPLTEGQQIPWNLLPVGVLPLVMTTFFEELLFQGFMQTRLEKGFGAGPAIVLAGLFFALYHLGYPGFRTAPDIALLFAVGMMFALAFKLSKGNLVVAYFVNLPNAFVTYVMKATQFPTMTFESDVYAAITIAAIVVLLACFARMPSADKEERS